MQRSPGDKLQNGIHIVSELSNLLANQIEGREHRLFIAGRADRNNISFAERRLSGGHGLTSLFLAAGELLGSGGTIRAGDQQISKKPFFQNAPGTLGQFGKLNAAASRLIAPNDPASAVDEALGFREIEANGYRAIDFERFAGLDGETIFVQIEEFTQVHHQAGLRAIKTGVNRAVKLLTNTTAPFSVGCNRIRHSSKTAIHGWHHINSETCGGGTPILIMRGETRNGFSSNPTGSNSGLTKSLYQIQLSAISFQFSVKSAVGGCTENWQTENGSRLAPRKRAPHITEVELRNSASVNQRLAAKKAASDCAAGTRTGMVSTRSRALARVVGNSEVSRLTSSWRSRWL